MAKSIKLQCPDQFSFPHTVYSHGWSELVPFEFDLDKWILRYVFIDDFGKNPTLVSISDDNGYLALEINSENIDENFLKKIRFEIRHIFRLDDDLSEFYDLTSKHESLRWIKESNAGRLIRSPTVFEDLIKTICTTNCSWGFTKSMTTNLVEKLGVEGKNAKKAFPTAQIMAAQTVDFYREEIRAGYRSSYFVELSKSVASGKIDPESWLNSDLQTTELKKEMKSIKGVGDYAAENLLKLVGRYDGLALDSWLRAQFYKKHNGGEPCNDNQICEFYEQFGTWRGLVIWCDLTERFLKFDN